MTSRYGDLLAHARLEVVPLQGVVDLVSAEAPRDFTVTVTCSPRHGVDRTIEVCEQLAARGYRTVPHIAAHCVGGRGHLDEILGRLDAAGVDEVFAVGGDGTKGPGAYPSAVELVADLANAPLRIGVAGYPEGHPAIPPTDLLDALERKAEHAAYLVTQMCFDPEHLRTWLAGLSERGFRLPVLVGVAGAVKRRKLVEMSMKVGVGSSLRYLTKNVGATSSLLRRGTYTPAALLGGLASIDLPSTPPIAGVHVFTFNQLAATTRWLDDVDEATAP